MTDYVRVKQAETGHELTLPRDYFEQTVEGGFTEIDKDPVDGGGVPLPPKYHTTVTKAAASKTTGQTATTKEN